MLLGFPLRLTLDAMNPRSNIYRALMTNPGPRDRPGRATACTRVISKCRPAAALELPGPSRTPYGVFAAGGRELGLRQETLDLLAGARNSPGARVLRRMHEGRRRAVLAGLHEADASLAVRQPRFVRVPWSGWFAGLCGSDRRASVRATSRARSGTYLTGDPRDVALRDALYAALQSSEFIKGR